MKYSKLPPSTLQAHKASLRTVVRARLDALPPQVRQQESQEVCQRLMVLLERRKWRSVLAFLPDASEPDLVPFLRHCLERGYPVALPRLLPERTLSFRIVRSLDGPWDRHRWGIDQPQPSEPEWVDDDALVLVPGVAFDPRGGRLGRGGGFFDRFLAAHPGVRAWGVGFACQLVSELPLEVHDRPLSGLILGGDSSILNLGGLEWD